MTPERIKKLRELAEKATPGKWSDDGVCVRIEGTRTFIVSMVGCDDAKFIAAANPAAILELLDEVERLRNVQAAFKNQQGECRCHKNMITCGFCLIDTTTGEVVPDDA